MEGVTATQNMSIQKKTHTRAHPKSRTSWVTSENWRRCTRYWKYISTPFSYQRCFPPTPKSSKFWSLPTLRPTCPKISKTMDSRRQSTPRHPAALTPGRHLGLLNQASAILHVKVRDAALQARAGYLLNVCLLGAD